MSIAADPACAFEEIAAAIARSHPLLDPDVPVLGDRRFLVDGRQVAISWRPDDESIGMYADLGVPRECPPRALREALELNHSGHLDDVVIGLHGESHRLVAFTLVPLAVAELVRDIAGAEILRLAAIASSLALRFQ